MLSKGRRGEYPVPEHLTHGLREKAAAVLTDCRGGNRDRSESERQAHGLGGDEAIVALSTSISHPPKSCHGILSAAFWWKECQVLYFSEGH